MKLKQRVVLLAILLVIFIFTKVFLIDNLDTSAANREDQRAFHRMMTGLRVELVPKLDHTLQSPWEIAAQWVVPQEVYPEETPELGAIMHAMATKKIIKADVGYKGTQLKALLILEGGQKVVFKPKRYSRDYVVEGEPYAGYDRHNAEVAAFHLDRILGFRRAPLVVGRFVNLRTEIKPVATEQLLSTFLTVATGEEIELQEGTHMLQVCIKQWATFTQSTSRALTFPSNVAKGIPCLKKRPPNSLSPGNSKVKAQHQEQSSPESFSLQEILHFLQYNDRLPFSSNSIGSN